MEAQTGTTQTIAATKTYDAFGNLDSSSGTWSGPFSYGGGFGYQQDADYGLKLLGHRYFDSSTGRFLTRDSVKDGKNWYVYCRSTPISHADISGLATVSLGVDFAAALILVGGEGHASLDFDLETHHIGATVGGGPAIAPGLGFSVGPTVGLSGGHSTNSNNIRLIAQAFLGNGEGFSGGGTFPIFDGDSGGVSGGFFGPSITVGAAVLFGFDFSRSWDFGDLYQGILNIWDRLGRVTL